MQPENRSELKEEVKEPAPLLSRFSVGDLVWTKVSGYPWWPCMVTTDPELNHHFKQKQKSEKLTATCTILTCPGKLIYGFIDLCIYCFSTANGRSGLLYHVQYFGDAPERGYIFEKNMVSFTGEDQYQELSRSNKQPASRINHKKVCLLLPPSFGLFPSMCRLCVLAV